MSTFTKRDKIVWGSIGGALLLTTVIGVSTSATTATPTAAPAPTATATPTPTPDTTLPPVEEVPAEFTTSEGDWSIKLKTTRKQCFGSAGCNVTLKPEVSYEGFLATLPDEGTVSLTFKVSGDESGSVIDTIDVDLADDGTYSTNEIMISTSSSGVTPKAKVTDAEYSEW